MVREVWQTCSTMSVMGKSTDLKREKESICEFMPMKVVQSSLM